MQDDNLPSAGAAGAIVLLAQAIKSIKGVLKTTIKQISSSDKHVELERGENGDVTLSLVDVASKSETAQSVQQLTDADSAINTQLEKLTAFTGYEDELDLVAKVNEILGE